MATGLDLYGTIVNIMKTTQVSSATHQKSLMQMKKLLLNNNLREFTEQFQIALEYILVAGVKGNPYVDRLLNFISSFCTSMEVPSSTADESILESPFLRSIFDYLLVTQNLASDSIRFRSCELISKLFNHMIDVDLSIELCDNIQEAMMKRSVDCKAIIRQQAFGVLYALQDPTNLDCEIISRFIKQLNGDPSAKVRAICVEKVCLRKDVIPHIVNRTRDIDMSVRLAAFKKVSNYPKHFQIMHKQTIIKNGFADQSVAIKKFIEQQFIPMWLEKYEFNYLLFLKALRLDSNIKDIQETTVVVEYVLSALFSQRPQNELLGVLPINEDKLILYENLNWETVIYWRILIQHLRKFTEFETILDDILPELVHFCKYIKEYYITNKPKYEEDIDNQHMEYQFIIHQLFIITLGYDFGDPVGRKCLNSLIAEILQNAVLSMEVIDVIIKNLNNTMPNIKEQAIFVCELISEILYPTTGNNNTENKPTHDEETYQIAQLKMKLNMHREEQQMCIKEFNFIRAETLKNEMEAIHVLIKNKEVEMQDEGRQQIERTNDKQSLIKCLDIANALLCIPKVTILSPMLRSLKDEVIHDLLIHEDAQIKCKAFKSIALCCLIDKKSAEVGIHIFCAQLEMYKAGLLGDGDIVKIAISAVVDLIRVFGPNLIANPREHDLENPSDSFDEEKESIFKGGSSLTAVVQGLVDFMQDEDPSIQELAGRGLCQFLIDDLIHSPSVVSRLILKWCSPTYDEEDGEILRQRIGMTLEELPLHPNSADQLERAVLPTIRVLVRAPKKNPLSSVNVDNIIKFMLALCLSNSEGIGIHANIAIQICSEITEKPSSKCNPAFSRALSLLVLPNDDADLIETLLEQCDMIRDEVSDKSVLKNIVKFIAILNTKYNQPDTTCIGEKSGTKTNRSITGKISNTGLETVIEENVHAVQSVIEENVQPVQSDTEEDKSLSSESDSDQ